MKHWRVYIALLFVLLVGLCAHGQGFQWCPPFLAKSAGQTSIFDDALVWLKPDTLSGTNGENIHRWNDSTYHQYNVTNSTANSVWLTNNFLDGYPILKFVGNSTSWLRWGENDGLSICAHRSSMSWFAIADFDPGAETSLIWFSITNNSNYRLAFVFTLDNKIRFDIRCPDNAFKNSTIVTSTNRLMTLWEFFVDFSGGKVCVFNNGISVATNAVAMASQTDANSQEGHIAYVPGSGNAWPGKVAEILAFDHWLDTTNRMIVEAYFHNKFPTAFP